MFLFLYLLKLLGFMKNLTYLILIIPILSLFSQGIGINTTLPMATLHVNGDMKFTPKASDATRLVGIISNGEVKEFELGNSFNITTGTLTVIPPIDSNIFLIGDVDQFLTAPTTDQYDNYDIGLANINIDKTIIRVFGETNGYSVTGFTDGFDGRIIYYYNSQNNNVTFFDLNLGSDAKNQIITGSGANEGTTGEGVAQFIYDGSLEKWILINIR
jgi:hypothetical protein